MMFTTQSRHRFLLALKHTASHIQLALILLLALAMTHCASKKEDEFASERALYETAQAALDNRQYDLAVENFRKIELRYPFGRFAEQAQLESIYAYYQNDELTAANIAADRFIRQYPEHPNLDYAYYLKALSNYHVDNDLTSRFLKESSVKRDLSAVREAFRDFNTLILRYPDSDYAADAQKRMLYIRDLVARQEIEVANYYMQRAAYVAALNRAKAVVENYPGTQANADGLAIMVHAYTQMGMADLASDSLTVLRHNFPNYEKLRADGSLAPYDKLYYDEINWLNFVSFGLLGKQEDVVGSRSGDEAANSGREEKTQVPRAPVTTD